MNDSLETLAGFLRHFNDEVEGRSPLNPPPPEAREALEALTHGSVSEAEQQDLLRRLRKEPGWVEFLASLMREHDPISSSPHPENP